MILSALIAALIWERYHPDLPDVPRAKARQWLAWLLDNFNAGGEQHGLLAWSLGVALPVLGVVVLSAVLHEVAAPLGWLFDVAVLYACLGFKRATYHAASISRDLQAGNIDQARQRLQDWRPAMVVGQRAEDLVVLTTEALLQQAFVRFLGVAFWFVLLGAAGAVLMMLTHLAHSRWQAEPRFAHVASRVAYGLDWLPSRVVAFSFAIVGNFQDAQESWRSQMSRWGDEAEGIVLAAGAGALGLQLGGVLQGADPDVQLPRPELGIGERPDATAIDGVVALIWRTALLWAAALGLVWLGGL